MKRHATILLATTLVSLFACGGPDPSCLDAACSISDASADRTADAATNDAGADARDVSDVVPSTDASDASDVDDAADAAPDASDVVDVTGDTADASADDATDSGGGCPATCVAPYECIGGTCTMCGLAGQVCYESTCTGACTPCGHSAQPCCLDPLHDCVDPTSICLVGRHCS